MPAFATQSTFVARTFQTLTHIPRFTPHTPLSRAPLRRASLHTVTPAMLLKRKSAAAIVIGDEILTGKTQDTNTQTLARFLVAHGVVLTKTETILDDVPTIASTVARLSDSHDLVFTSGGIGPTLDDLTYRGVATAFGLPLAEHAPTVAAMRAVQPHMELNAARLRMAALPAGCETFWTEGLWVPLCCVRGNVYVLPGIPKLFTRMLGSVPKARLGQAPARVRRVVLCQMGEGDLADALQHAKDRNADVAIGSYPATTESARKQYRTKITFEGDDESEVCDAAQEVCAAVSGQMEVREVV